MATTTPRPLSPETVAPAPVEAQTPPQHTVRCRGGHIDPSDPPGASLRRGPCQGEVVCAYLDLPDVFAVAMAAPPSDDVENNEAIRVNSRHRVDEDGDPIFLEGPRKYGSRHETHAHEYEISRGHGEVGTDVEIWRELGLSPDRPAVVPTCIDHLPSRATVVGSRDPKTGEWDTPLEDLKARYSGG